MNKNKKRYLNQKSNISFCAWKEGCSSKTLKYYREILERFINDIDKPIKEITTDEIRHYLTNYKEQRGCSLTSIDNIRRVFSSFFKWLEDEDYIVKSPIRRIHKIKTLKQVKEPFTDEEIEKMREACKNIRDLAIIEILYSTGIRVGELINLNIKDMNFAERSCIVLGKGNKQREVYFDVKTKMHIQEFWKREMMIILHCLFQKINHIKGWLLQL